MINFISAFNWYGFLIAAGMVIAIMGAYYAAPKRGIKSDFVFEIALFTIPLAIIGARLYYVIFDIIAGGHWTFGRFFGFYNGGFEGFRGLAIYGGLIGAVIGAGILILYQRRRPQNERVNFLQMADLAFPFIIMAQAVGRWGNFANAEAYGNYVANPALQWFPYAVKIGNNWFQATFFYEFVLNMAGFGFMLWLLLGKRRSFDGFIFCVYCIIYGGGRFFIEGLRSDSLWLIPNVVRVSQVVSAVIFISAIIVILAHVYIARNNNKKIFMFALKEHLGDDYLWYDKTLLKNPLAIEQKPKKPFFGFFDKADDDSQKEGYFQDDQEDGQETNENDEDSGQFQSGQETNESDTE